MWPRGKIHCWQKRFKATTSCGLCCLPDLHMVLRDTRYLSGQITSILGFEIWRCFDTKERYLAMRNQVAPRAVARRVIELLIIDCLRLSLTDAWSSIVLDCRSPTQWAISEPLLLLDTIYKRTWLFMSYIATKGKTLSEDDAATYEVLLTLTRTLNMTELVDYNTSVSASRSVAQTQELLQALNIMIVYKSRTDPETVTAGRTGRVSKASDQPWVPLGGGLKALRSFVSGVIAATERVLINVQVKNLPFLVPMPFTKLLNEFRMAGGSPQSLRPFLRLVSIEVTYIQRRANGGKIVPRYKTILGLASRRDENDFAHPPRVPRDGVSTKAVEFWLEDADSAAAGSSKKAKAKAAKPVDKGGYISVFDFFRTRKSYQVCKFSGRYLF